MNRFNHLANNAAITKLFVGLIALLITGTSWAQAPAKKPLTADLVRKAIKRGVDNLKKNQRPDGSWVGVSGYEGGSNALVTLALLNAGEKASSPQIQKSLELILAIPRSKTYEVALRVLALSAADPYAKRYRATIQGDIEWLLKGQTESGGWNYNGVGETADGSNAQFVLLALSEANKYKIPIPKTTWQKAKSFGLICTTLRAAVFNTNSAKPLRAA